MRGAPSADPWPGEHRHALAQFLGDIGGVREEPRRRDVLARIEDVTVASPDLAKPKRDPAHRRVARRAVGKCVERGAGGDGRRCRYAPGCRNAGRQSGIGRTSWILLFQEAAFRSQGAFLDFPRVLQQRHNVLLAWLGLTGAPTIRKVVDHLLHCVDADEQPSDAVISS